MSRWYDTSAFMERVLEERAARRWHESVVWLAQYERSREHIRVRALYPSADCVIDASDVLALADAEQFVCSARVLLARYEAAYLQAKIRDTRDGAHKDRLRREKEFWTEKEADYDALFRRLAEEPRGVLCLHDDLLEPGYWPIAEVLR